MLNNVTQVQNEKMVALGLVALLVVLSGICLVFGMSRYSRTRNSAHAFAWLAWISLSVLGLAFNLLMFFVGGLEGDADRGTLETYKTPLGGGYYLVSRMGDGDLPLPLKHVSDEGTPSIGEHKLVTGLSCFSGQPYLKFEGSYGRINLRERTLERLSAGELPLSSNGELRWTSKYDFSKTPCAKVSFSSGDIWRNAVTYLTIPALILLSLFGLLAWGRRIPTVPRVPKERSPDW